MKETKTIPPQEGPQSSPVVQESDLEQLAEAVVKSIEQLDKAVLEKYGNNNVRTDQKDDHSSFPSLPQFLGYKRIVHVEFDRHQPLMQKVYDRTSRLEVAYRALLDFHRLNRS